MSTAGQTSQHQPEAESPMRPQRAPAGSENGKPVWVEPDLEFIRVLARQGGDSLKKCFQCGTCSATCELSPDSEPFPRKEMAWSNWGMKDRLLADPDVWLCYQCNDCSTSCPRGARPGDVLGAVRQACVRHYSAPRFLARWVNQPHCIPLLLGIPTALLSLALVARDPIAKFLNISNPVEGGIVYAYSGLFPHWLLNGFFGLFSILVLLAVVTGIARFWHAMKKGLPPGQGATPAKGLLSSIGAALKSIITHDDFALCTKARPRRLSHLCVFFGFIALSFVSFWVITARYNPLMPDDFVYPFGFWNPWKMLANLGGAALIVGCLLMMRERLRNGEENGAGSYFDWALISMLLLVGLSGFGTEVLHYLRLEPHRHIIYFVHLVFAFAVLMYLPYSKLAHLFYRGTAMVFVERFGRKGKASPLPADSGQDGKTEGNDDADDTAAEQ